MPLILTGDDYFRAYREKPGAYRTIADVEPDGAIVPCSKGLNSRDYDRLRGRAIQIATQRIRQPGLIELEEAKRDL